MTTTSNHDLPIRLERLRVILAELEETPASACHDGLLERARAAIAAVRQARQAPATKAEAAASAVPQCLG
jgi:hypothetical protein